MYFFSAYELPTTADCIKQVGDNLLNVRDFIDQPCEEKVIPFANCNVPLLFIAGSDDQLYHPEPQVSN